MAIKTTSNCPECEKPLGRVGRGDARFSPTAKILFIVAGVVTMIWCSIVLLWSPVFLVPRGVGGIMICAFFYLGPGLLIGGIANALPKIRTLFCNRCGWTETRTLTAR